jgi:hypothetical protein
MDKQRAKKLQEQQAAYSSLVDICLQSSGVAAPLTSVRTNAARLIHSSLLDYKHHSPTNLKKSVEMLKLSADNILQHPEEIKYRRVIIALLAVSSHPLTQLSHEIVTLNDTIKLVPCDKLDSKSQ